MATGSLKTESKFEGLRVELIKRLLDLIHHL
jgi:hypothetical protein